jgi:hypothetical protein
MNITKTLTMLACLAMVSNTVLAQKSPENLVRNAGLNESIGVLPNGFMWSAKAGVNETGAVVVERTEPENYSFYVVTTLSSPLAPSYRFGGKIKIRPGLDTIANIIIQFNGTENNSYKYLGSEELVTTRTDNTWEIMEGLATIPAGTTEIQLIVCLPRGVVGEAIFEDLFCYAHAMPGYKTQIPLEGRVQNNIVSENYLDDIGAYLKEGFRFDPNGAPNGGLTLVYERADETQYSFQAIYTFAPKSAIYTYGGQVRLDAKAGNAKSQAGYFVQYFADTECNVYLGGDEVLATRSDGKWVTLNKSVKVPKEAKIMQLGAIMPHDKIGKVWFYAPYLIPN